MMGCIFGAAGRQRDRALFPCQDLRCGGRSDLRRRLLAQNFHLCRHYRRHRPYFDDNFRKARLFWKPAFCPNCAQWYCATPLRTSTGNRSLILARDDRQRFQQSAPAGQQYPGCIWLQHEVFHIFSRVMPALSC